MKNQPKPLFNKVHRYVILFILFCLGASTAHSQLKADFTSNTQAGCAPLVVQFADSSTGNPTSWSWDLGNGTTSVFEKPSVAYFEPGTYTVKLTIKNAFGTDSVTRYDYITVYSSPVINFNASTLTGCFPLSTQFTDLSLPGSGLVSSWQWDFGDGNFSQEQNPEHTYNSTGKFNVSLRAANNFGCVTSKTITDFIHIQTGVKAGFGNSTPKSCNAPATINFTDSSTGTGSLKYKWDFGDGNTSTAANPSHTYTFSGSFTVSLIVSNGSGCTDTIVKQNLVTVGATIADFKVPELICEGTPVKFTNTGTPVPANATWDFGDGTTSNAVHPVKVFIAPGTYIVSMVSNNGACKDSVFKEIKVIEKPDVSFFSADTVSCQAPFNVGFTNTSITGSNIVNNMVIYHWDFGDGNTSDQKSPSHTYTKEGNFTVKLFVTNIAGCKDSLVIKNYIRIKKPVASINNLPQKGCAPLSHKFTSTISSIDPVVSYHWDFGDGTSSDSITPTHVYNTPGKYTVTLTYTTQSGCVNSVKVENGIWVGSRPEANYTADPLNACANQSISFTDQTKGNANEWIWFFGDGSSANTQNPTHQYIDTGYFSVTLIASHNGCADTITIPNKIHINPPVARYTFTRTCTDPRQIIFKDNSIGADVYHWDFGDGSSSAEANPVKEYPVPGKYTVVLTVTNNATGCTQNKTQVIHIIREKADFSTVSNETCKNSSVVFSAPNTNPDNISSYTWKFGDGKSVVTKTKSVSHKYTKAGTYDVTLIIKDLHGCIDSIVKPMAMKVNGPTSVFRSDIAGTCLNNTVNFIDSSYSDGEHPITQWQFNWGDGTVQNFNAPPFSHTYSKPGRFSVSLIVTDSKGCTDTLRKPNMIVVSQPIAAFSADTLSCTTQAVKFKNISSGPGLIYNWDFGDGNTSTAKDPVHLYNTEGIYTVSLSINDQYGCSGFVSKTNYVRIANPVADFILSDSVGTCPPLVVNFTNTSVNYSSWSWDFGDGTTSKERNPSHFYSQVGTFTAVLTIQGPGGCVSKKSRTIKVDGPSGTFSYTNMMGCAPLKSTFKASTQKNLSFLWDFNDGTTLTTKDSTVEHTYTTPGKYLPKMILIDESGCHVSVKGGDTIEVFGVIASFEHDGALVCDSSQVRFTNTSTQNDAIVKYLWSFGDGTTSSQAQPTHVYNNAGVYQTSLELTTQRGCKDFIQLDQPVKVNVTPSISISGDAGACVPAMINFAGNVLNPDTSSISWKWDFGNGNASTQQIPAGQTYPAAGNFIVKTIGLSSNGCSDTATRSVEIYPLPKLAIAADTVVCVGTSQTIKVTGAQSYVWSPSPYLSCIDCATPVSKPDANVTYFVKGASAKGCEATDSVSLVVKFPFKLSVSKADTLCLGERLQLNASGTDLYSWSPATGLNDHLSASPVAFTSATTNYRVIGTDSKGCFSDTAYVPVKVYPVPVVNAGEDKTINVGRQVEIIPQVSPDVTQVVWTPSLGIVSSNNSNSSVIVKPQETIEYTIEVKNPGGCAAKDKVSVFVLCNNANVFMPNTFSPNGDGSNDIFYPRGSGVFRVQNLKIFSRWGEVVFEKANFNANDASAGWDGTYKGKKLNADVFVYTLQVVCENNSTLTFNGNIALIK